MKIFIGIDPGLYGAVGVLTENGPAVFDMPTILKGASGTVKFEIDAGALHRIISPYTGARAALERVSSRPENAGASVFSLGDSYGVARAILASTNCATTYVTPQAWKKHFKLTSDKEESRAMAARLYPTVDLHLKKYADRAEALLIATYLKEISG